MPNDYFTFKQFTIQQDKCAMKVGTDGVLLGAWTDISGARHILDVGTGSGLIAIMLAQRSAARIDAVEIDKDAYTQSCTNVAACPWSERIHIHHASFQNFAKSTDQLYDLIVSNPPYFIRSLKNPGKSRETARHTSMLTYDDLLKNAMKLITEEGNLSIILPFEESKLFDELAQKYGLICNRKVNVISCPGKPIKRVMMNLGRKAGIFQEYDLLIEKGGRHHYSEEYIRLTRDYYLSF